LDAEKREEGAAKTTFQKNKEGENQRKKLRNLEKVKIAKIRPDLPVECAAPWEGYERV